MLIARSRSGDLRQRLPLGGSHSAALGAAARAALRAAAQAALQPPCTALRAVAKDCTGLRRPVAEAFLPSGIATAQLFQSCSQKTRREAKGKPPREEAPLATLLAKGHAKVTALGTCTEDLEAKEKGSRFQIKTAEGSTSSER